jgi:peptidoglycan/xylan/chitin deacetylase (PgdA/CDA1 family)
MKVSLFLALLVGGSILLTALTIITYDAEGIISPLTDFFTPPRPSLFDTSRLAKSYEEISQSEPSPSPTPRPLTFVEMNNLYGPCARVPTLIYHHIEDLKEAQAKGHLWLAVSPEYFQKHLEYLATKGYTTISMAQLADFFDNSTPLPPKPVLLTFDDAYEDFYFNAYPLLSRMNMKATMFTPTGLVDNSGYLTWNEISQMATSGNVLFANHTWSHKNLQTTSDVVEKEISTADSQLADRGFNRPKVFADPYGASSAYAIEYLNKLGYKLAFTTRTGSVLCAKQRLVLPRIRISNSELSRYGF